MFHLSNNNTYNYWTFYKPSLIRSVSTISIIGRVLSWNFHNANYLTSTLAWSNKNQMGKVHVIDSNGDSVIAVHLLSLAGLLLQGWDICVEMWSPDELYYTGSSDCCCQILRHNNLSTIDLPLGKNISLNYNFNVSHFEFNEKIKQRKICRFWTLYWLKLLLNITETRWFLGLPDTVY